MTDNKPVKKFKAGRVEAAVWKHTKQEGDEERVYYTISVQKNYKDKHDEWQKCHTFNTDEALRLSLLVTKAYEYVVLREDDDKKTE